MRNQGNMESCQTLDSQLQRSMNLDQATITRDTASHMLLILMNSLNNVRDAMHTVSYIATRLRPSSD